MTKFICLGVVIAALAAAPLLAQQGAAVERSTTRAEMQQRLAERFAEADTNRDGFLTEAELASGLQIGAYAAAMLARLDTDRDGKISLTEFSFRQLAMFDAADTNHDGVVTREEGEAAMRARMQEQNAIGARK